MRKVASKATRALPAKGPLPDPRVQSVCRTYSFNRALTDIPIQQTYRLTCKTIEDVSAKRWDAVVF